MTTPRLFKRNDTGRNLAPEAPGWRERPYYFQVQVRGKRYLRCLDTNDAARAAVLARLRAKEIHDAILRNDVAALKGTPLRAAPCATVGDIIARYESAAPGATGIRTSTVRKNACAIALILRRVHGESCDVPKLPANRLDADLLEKFKRQTVDAAGGDFLEQRKKRISANSFILQARAIFAKKLGENFYAGLPLPPSLPGFMAVRLFKIGRKRFCRPDAAIIARTRANSAALRESDPNAYLSFLLAMGCGLRKNEIAHARRRWIEGGRIRIQTQSDFQPKSNHERCLPLEPWVASELAEMVPADREYILNGHMTERCDKTFRRLNDWLTAQGWDRRLKTHELRKLFGDLVTQQAGIRAAQVLLGHANVSTTEGHYADPASSIVPVHIFPAA